MSLTCLIILWLASLGFPCTLHSNLSGLPASSQVWATNVTERSSPSFCFLLQACQWPMGRRASWHIPNAHTKLLLSLKGTTSMRATIILILIPFLSRNHKEWCQPCSVLLYYITSPLSSFLQHGGGLSCSLRKSFGGLIRLLDFTRAQWKGSRTALNFQEGHHIQ